MLKEWEATVVAAGGTWSLVTSPDLLPKPSPIPQLPGLN